MAVLQGLKVFSMRQRRLARGVLIEWLLDIVGVMLFD